jgi:hypothetical protein
MELLNDPDCGVAVTVRLEDPPEASVTEDGVVPKVSVGFVGTVPSQVDVKFTAPEIWF